MLCFCVCVFFFSSRRRHTRCALVTGVQTCALPICSTLFVYDGKADELFSRYAEGIDTREIRIPANQGIAGAVFAIGHVENIADPYADPRLDRKSVVVGKECVSTCRSRWSPYH